MLSKALIVLALVAAAQAAARKGHSPTDLGKQGKGLDTFFSPLISIINLNNDPCDTKSGSPLQGTCYSEKDCKVLEGRVDGDDCDNRFAVCCVISGNTTISKSGAYFKGAQNGNTKARTIFPFVEVNSPTNLGYQPATALTIDPPAGTQQIRFDFEDLTLLGPIEGDCNNDTVVFTGANLGSEVPVICGENSGQHMYVDIDASEGPYNLVITTSEVEFDRSWNIKVTFLNNGDALKAPPRCLQYYTETEGDIMSFNTGEDNQMALNNQEYSICFGYVAGFCDVGVTFTRFDLGNIGEACGDDVVKVQGQQICGDIIDYTVRANATGPISFNIHTDELNELSEEGFTGKYMMLECE